MKAVKDKIEKINKVIAEPIMTSIMIFSYYMVCILYKL